MKKALGRILAVLLLSTALIVVLVNIILYQLNYDHDFSAYVRILAVIVMIFILFIWLFLSIGTLFSKKKFSISSNYPVEISTPLPKISIIVPAHNEEHDIHRCVKSIKEVSYPNLDLFVVDDRSADNTAEIVEEMAQNDERLKLIRIKELPEGWGGKVHALYKTASISDCDWLLFIDADVAIHKNAPEIALSYCLKENVKMLSILLEPDYKAFWEKVTMPLIFGSLEVWNPRKRVNDPDDNAAMGWGGFIFVESKTYWKFGGHKAIKNEIVDDLEIARLAKRKRIPYRYLRGRGLGLAYWYRTLGEMWSIWEKYIFPKLDYKLSNATITILLTFLINILPFAVFICQLIAILFNGTYQPFMLWLSIVQVLVIIAFRIYNMIQCNSNRYVFLESYFFLHFLGGIIFIAMTISSIFRSRS